MRNQIRFGQNDNKRSLFRLQHARPDFLDGEVLSDTANVPVMRPQDVEAWRVPIMDDSDDEQEAQVVPEEPSARHTAGGDMLRRTTRAATREGRAISPSGPVGRDSGVLRQSPGRDSISTAGLHQVSRMAEQFQGLLLDQPEI